ncbi:2Fe-2S iron-sulfur cluster-binding protein [Membranihabitans marinus]|uniref:2Fe-2S iron-sulfur cluster-binding protein n=1 Tax=Membranihabitans marinus TaxID=1227546 RepID=UPI001F019B83|nr:2Fe-2S iron-sulfur cluster-binding protein [Membranihabitans marinus]
MNTTFYPTTITKIIKETDEAIVVEFDANAEHLKTFRSGQYLTLRVKDEGKNIQRAYSLCTAPYENKWQVAIKRVDEGVFSTKAHETFEVGDQIEVMAPHGNFVLDIDPNHQKHYAFFAAGSGITPVISLLKDVLYHEKSSTVSLFYVNKSLNSTIFNDALASLKKHYFDRLDVYHFSTRENIKEGLFKGRIDADKCKKLIDIPLLDLDHTDEYLICGPYDMIMTIQDALKAEGVSKDKIHFELFTTQPNTKLKIEEKVENPTPNAEVKDEIEISQLKVTLMGETHEFEVKHDNRSILEHAINQGIDVPYSCQGGVCSTCRAKLIEGEVNMMTNFALVDSEVEEGYRLTCQSLPVSEKIHVNYDE